ncbi:MAG: competence/damage-inducible protein A [Clostridiales bacterium]|jgi:nicotinamide-nucleotide amidase|nr:competence/damage-inducible protein A [Clostridiales bacterium]
MKAEIVSIGTELLLGGVLNTNARYLARKLAELGVDAERQTTVGDNPGRVAEVFAEAFRRADVVITTGGLGDTNDDITRASAEDFMGGGAGRTILPNRRGYAEGFILESGGKAIIALPGPPNECEPMFANGAAPWIRARVSGTIRSRTIRLCGIGESSAARAIADILDSQSNPTVAPYAGRAEMYFRVSAKAGSAAEADALTAPVADEIYRRLGEYVYAEGEDATLAGTVTAELLRRSLTIALAESCTGGLLSSAITDIPGASGTLLECAVTYSNDAKIRRLGVPAETLARFGAVSAETASAMAEGAAKRSGADIGVSVTGIAGPGGGSPEKPVGLVWFGIRYNGVTRTEGRLFGGTGGREAVRARAVSTALDIIRRSIKEI